MADLRIARLAKAFGDTPVLRGIDLSVPSGALFAVLGASGSGKTTLLRLLGGFERVDDGTIEIDGRVVSGAGVHIPPNKRRVGYVSQEGSLFPHLSVADNVVFGLPRNERDLSKAESLLEKVGLTSRYARRGPHELSGGEQQRVALARALAPAPKLVLLDEPFSALDAALRIETRDAVALALAAVGATALLVTHDQSEALSLGRQIAVLRHGVVAQAAPPETLYRQPIDPDLAQFVGEAVLLPGTVKDGFVSCALGRLRLCIPTPNGVADVLVRPEQIRVSSQAAAAGTFGTVLTATYYGHDARVVVLLESGTPQVAARVVGHSIPRVGSRVWLEVEGDVMAYPLASPVGGPKSSSQSSYVLLTPSSQDLPEMGLGNAAKR